MNDREVNRAIIKTGLDKILNKEVENYDLSSLRLYPCEASEILENLGYEEGEVDTNGWQGDTWLKFYSGNKWIFTLFYCGYYGNMELQPGEDYDE